MADWWLPRRVFAQRREIRRPDRRVIVSPSGRCALRGHARAGRLGQHPHLATELVPQGLVYPVARYEGDRAFNSTGALVTGSRQNVDAYGGERRSAPTIFEALLRNTVCLRKKRG